MNKAKFRIPILLLLTSLPVVPAMGQSDADNYLSVNRTMGFRPAGFVTVESDYRFQIGKDLSWTYSAYDGSTEKEYSRSGKLPIAIELLEQRLGDYGLNDIPEPDPNEPQIADLPTITLQREMDGKPWQREIRPSSKEGLRLHYLVQFIVTGVQQIAVTESMLKNVQPRRSSEPLTIENSQALRDAFPEGESDEALSDMVDFDKQTVVIFRWAGSGQDDLFAFIDNDQDGKLIFAYRGGMTRDLRQHARCYIVPNDLEWEQVEVPPVRFRR